MPRDRIYGEDMTATEITKALDISDRRLAYLESRGEDKRNTVAWRDAVYERGVIERSIAFSAWKASKTVRS
jgi:hypothetical protein